MIRRLLLCRRVAVIILLAVLVIITSLLVLLFATTKHSHTPAALKQTSSSVTENKTTIHIAAMGDMLAHDSVDKEAKQADGSYDFGHYFTNIRERYKDADIVFCNQEGLAAGQAFGISGYPSFNAPLEFAAGLHNGAGCNLINTANNHLGDKSQPAIDATLDNWGRQKPLAIAGANRSIDEQNTVRYFNVKGVKFAFLAFADFNNNQNTTSYGVNIYHDTELFDRLLTEARTNAAIVMVSMHWGTEDSAALNTDQVAQVETLKAHNVDVVIGTGPHVLQKTEWQTRADGKKMLVWYSIGNMLSSQLSVDELTSCVATFDIVKTSENASVENPGCIPTFMSYSWTPDEKASNDLAARHDLLLKPLSSSNYDITRTLFTNTVSERQEYVQNTLGKDVVLDNR